MELPVANNPNSALYGASIRIALYSLLFQCLRKQTRQGILPELQRPPGKNKCAVRSFRLLGYKNPYSDTRAEAYCTRVQAQDGAQQGNGREHTLHNILTAVLMLAPREVSGHHWTCMCHCKTALASPLADENPTHKWCRRNQFIKKIKKPPNQPAILFGKYPVIDSSLAIRLLVVSMRSIYHLSSQHSPVPNYQPLLDDCPCLGTTGSQRLVRYIKNITLINIISLHTALECLEPIIRFLPFPSRTLIRPFLGVRGAFFFLFSPPFNLAFLKTLPTRPFFVLEPWLPVPGSLPRSPWSSTN